MIILIINKQFINKLLRESMSFFTFARESMSFFTFTRDPVRKTDIYAAQEASLNGG